MIIRGKGNSVEFVPENDLECYQLGFMFRDTPHELSIKEKKLDKLTISTANIWKHLTNT